MTAPFTRSSSSLTLLPGANDRAQWAEIRSDMSNDTITDRAMDSSAQASASTLKLLASETREAMSRIGHRVDVTAGTILFSEDDQTNELYIVESGELVSYQTGGEDDAEWPVQHSGPGDVVGEMSFLDGGARQLNARAETDSTLLRIDPVELLVLEGGDHFYDNLRASVAITVVQRLRIGTELHVATLKRQLELVRTQQHSGQFLLYTMALFSIGMIVNNVITEKLLEIDIYTQQFAWQYMLIVLVPSLLVVWTMKIPLRQLGLTSTGLRKSLIEGIVASLVVLAVSAAVVWTSWLSDSIPDLTVAIGWSLIPSYSLHSFLQELIARGFMQASFQRFLNDRRGVKSVVVSATMFGMFHIHFGLVAVGLTMISSIMFGLFYLRHQNLAGVTLLHIMAGACAFSIGIL